MRGATSYEQSADDQHWYNPHKVTGLDKDIKARACANIDAVVAPLFARLVDGHGLEIAAELEAYAHAD